MKNEATTRLKAGELANKLADSLSTLASIVQGANRELLALNMDASGDAETRRCVIRLAHWLERKLQVVLNSVNAYVKEADR